MKAHGQDFKQRVKMIDFGGQKKPKIEPGGLNFASGDAFDRQEPANRGKRPPKRGPDQPKTGPRAPRSELKRKTRGLHTCLGGGSAASAEAVQAYPGGFRLGKELGSTVSNTLVAPQAVVGGMRRRRDTADHRDLAEAK